jgi:hypothetical protein
MSAPRARLVEWTLRLSALALIAWYAAALLRERPAEATRAGVTAEQLPAALELWSAGARPDSVRLALDAAPDAVQRDWLVALRRSGTAMEWTDRGVSPSALEVFPAGGPGAESWVLLADEAGVGVPVADERGLIDTLRAAGGGAALRVPTLAGSARAGGLRPRASAATRDSLARRALLVLGHAGWEAGFVTTALEEAGWTVAARLAVAPGSDVVQGAPAAIDTARYAAVVAIDSTAARDASAIARFVHSGGGLLLLPGAAAAPGLRALAPAAEGRVLRAATAAFDSMPRLALDAVSLVRLAPTALVLESRGDAATVAAWRVGRGRVVQVGYVDSWRWRMEGPDGAPAAHRAWWSGLAAGVAYRASLPLDWRAADPAPLAALHDALGPPTAARDRPPARVPAGGPPRWAWPVALAALLAEWALRRARGER